MNFNIGLIDRVLRVVIGVAIISWGILTENVWGVIGIIPLVTGTVRWCPAYKLFGIKTCRVKTR